MPHSILQRTDLKLPYSLIFKRKLNRNGEPYASKDARTVREGANSIGIRLFHPPHDGHPWLTVGTINPRIGLTPTSKRPCWAHEKNS